MLSLGGLAERSQRKNGTDFDEEQRVGVLEKSLFRNWQTESYTIILTTYLFPRNRICQADVRHQGPTFHSVVPNPLLEGFLQRKVSTRCISKDI